ncbi:hydroxymethylbilane synthase [Novosphingobium sp. FSY-8]|uniref:Porphobilinogen deaminase n=1 Tax=Novosphingobium ovatum TaxID=1908523 RepID=A0ABW9XG31_9SPHN|nr:hydroxymethylbilane synthase [Novosphingobium ovatum]NBC37466.1 hydroxymethylbilane synthase [Novosphingobium ovatum]
MADSPVFPARPLRLGTRNSPLAMAQAHETRDRLCAAHGWSQDAITLVPVVAGGDKVLDRPLAEIGGKALWTKELDGWLYHGEIDLAVHSCKDVETIRPDWLTIAAFLPREDVRDALVGAASIADLPPGARIGTCAPRRAAQMLHARPDLTIVPFRGNVATRLGKLAAGEADATLLALAGLNRLDNAAVGTALDADVWLPAPAQGAIAIECRSDDAATRALLAAIDDTPTRAAVLAERALLAALGGNCHSAIAVHTVADGDTMTLRARLFSPDGADMVEGSAQVTGPDHAPVSALAADLLARAPVSITRHFAPPSA